MITTILNVTTIVLFGVAAVFGTLSVYNMEKTIQYQKARISSLEARLEHLGESNAKKDN